MITAGVAATGTIVKFYIDKRLQQVDEKIDKTIDQKLTNIFKHADKTLGLVAAYHPTNKHPVSELLENAKAEIVILSATAHTIYYQHKQVIENALHNRKKVCFFLLSEKAPTMYRQSFEASNGRVFDQRKEQTLIWINELEKKYPNEFSVKFYYDNFSNYTGILIDGNIEGENHSHNTSGKLLLNFTGWNDSKDLGIKVILEPVLGEPSNSFNTHAKHIRDRWNGNTISLEKEKQMFKERKTDSN